MPLLVTNIKLERKPSAHAIAVAFPLENFHLEFMLVARGSIMEKAESMPKASKAM